MSSIAIDGENVPWSRTPRTIPCRLCLPLLKALVTYGNSRIYETLAFTQGLSLFTPYKSRNIVLFLGGNGFRKYVSKHAINVWLLLSFRNQMIHLAQFWRAHLNLFYSNKSLKTSKWSKLIISQSINLHKSAILIINFTKRERNTFSNILFLSQIWNACKLIFHINYYK